MGPVAEGPHRVGRWRLCMEFVYWAFRRRTRFRVTGDSMRPTLAPGDVVLVRRLRRWPVPAGTLVVARVGGRVMVKRVRSCGVETVALGSDDPTAGTDSRHFGSIPRADLFGEVTLVATARGWVGP